MHFDGQKLLISSFRSVLTCSVIRRPYARGSRFLPPSQISGQSHAYGRCQERTKKDLNENAPPNSLFSRYRQETPQQLLENAASFQNDRKTKRMEDVWNSPPYPKNSNWQQSQAKHSKRPTYDPVDTSIILFPGQGTQFVGMGKGTLDFPKVQEMFEMASNILGFNLLKLCLEGPKNTLDQTLYCQPAVLVTSLAALEKLNYTNPKAVQSCIATAGFSIGEITALTFAGALTFENAVKLVKIRAEAMHLASGSIPSGMMTVFLGPDSNVRGACSLAKEHCKNLGLEDFDCVIANYLHPTCKVIAGNIEALNFIEKYAADFKLKRLKRLPVSGAFHTSLMSPAVKIMEKALKKIPILEPVIPVHSNVDGKMYKGSGHIVKQLPKQIQKPVLWEQTMHILYERNSDQAFPQTYECGPGSSLNAILKMVNSKAAASATSIDV